MIVHLEISFKDLFLCAVLKGGCKDLPGGRRGARCGLLSGLRGEVEGDGVARRFGTREGDRALQLQWETGAEARFCCTNTACRFTGFFTRSNMLFTTTKMKSRNLVKGNANFRILA